jgi:hypothetical protein
MRAAVSWAFKAGPLTAPLRVVVWHEDLVAIDLAELAHAGEVQLDELAGAVFLSGADVRVYRDDESALHISHHRPLPVFFKHGQRIRLHCPYAIRAPGHVRHLPFIFNTKYTTA